MKLTYLLPIRAADPVAGELIDYVQWLSTHAEVIVVDGSSPDVFAAHAGHWAGVVTHVAVDPDVLALMNGKVAGVLTGLRRASHERVVIADDDVRYDEQSLSELHAALDAADVVRPQNYFQPLPWHAAIDSGRILLNRATGGDWPGTLGVRRSVLRATGGYDGNVLFENLELVRTIRAAGGAEARPFGLYVRRLPPRSDHFWSQRVRQAYDEFARPWRLAVWLSLAPAVGALTIAFGWRALGAVVLTSVALAELGRSRAGGRRYFPHRTVLGAPIWLCERAVCAWVALASRIVLGGIPYRGRIVSRAATPFRQLTARLHSRATAG